MTDDVQKLDEERMEAIAAQDFEKATSIREQIERIKRELEAKRARRPYDWHCDHVSGEQVDLNDPATYTDSPWFPKKYLAWDVHDLRHEIHKEIAFSLYYMTILHPDWPDKDQYERVIGFARAFARESREPDRWTNRRWLLKQLFLILDETENQC